MHSYKRLAVAAIAVAVGGTGLGCSSSSAADESSSRAAEAVDFAAGAGNGDADYTFFLVSRSPWGGFEAQALGRNGMGCPDGWYSSSCHVDDIDLSVLALAQDDADSILAEIGTSPTKETLLFVGTLDRTTGRRGCGRTSLHTFEIWRAPEPAPVHASDTWFHISHDATQALRINRWQQRAVTSIDLSNAPLIQDCEPDGDGGAVCTSGHEGVLEDAKLPTGIVVDGTMDRDGTVHVRQFYAKIGVGQIHLDNGYFFCRADQFACTINANCVADESMCKQIYWHGTGLNVYSRTTQVVVQPWLVQTSQLTAAESAAIVGK